MKKNVYGDTGAMRARGQNIFRKRDVTEQIKDRIMRTSQLWIKVNCRL